jgi:hypothetical protein
MEYLVIGGIVISFLLLITGVIRIQSAPLTLNASLEHFQDCTLTNIRESKAHLVERNRWAEERLKDQGFKNYSEALDYFEHIRQEMDTKTRNLKPKRRE